MWLAGELEVVAAGRQVRLAGHRFVLYRRYCVQQAGLVDYDHGTNRRSGQKQILVLTARPARSILWVGAGRSHESYTSADRVQTVCIPRWAGWCNVDGQESGYQVLPCGVPRGTVARGRIGRA